MERGATSCPDPMAPLTPDHPRWQCDPHPLCSPLEGPRARRHFIWPLRMAAEEVTIHSVYSLPNVKESRHGVTLAAHQALAAADGRARLNHEALKTTVDAVALAKGPMYTGYIARVSSAARFAFDGAPAAPSPTIAKRRSPDAGWSTCKAATAAWSLLPAAAVPG